MGHFAPSFHRAGRIATLITLAVIAIATPAFAYAPVLRTIDSAGSVGGGASSAVVNGRLAVSYADDTNQRLKLWYDNGAGGGTAGDLIANGSEIRTLDASRTVTSSGTAVGKIYNFGGRLAVAYCDAGNWDVILWVDDGAGGGTADDAIANGSEIRVIDTAGQVGLYTVITSLNGKLAVAYYDVTTPSLKLWYDDGAGGGTAGDNNVNGTEIRTISLLDAQEPAIAVVNGRLAIAFQDFTPQNLMLWYDDGAGGGTADNATADGSEVRTVSADNPTGFFNSIYSFNTHIAVGYMHFSDSSMRLWLDDGAGSGVADNGLAEGTEIRNIEAPSMGGSGVHTSISEIHNHLAMVSWGTPPAGLRIWYDDGNGSGTADDIAANGSEIRTIGSTDAGYYSTITAIGTTLVATYNDGNTADLMICLLEVASPPDAPSSLAPTALVTGGSTTDTTPTLEFTQTDPNLSDTLAFRIQIDDTAGFSSPIVDYTSASISQGATSFTVGQSAGSGSYTTGSASQTLAIGSYYWRVRTNDGATDSSWTAANSGAVALVVVAAPTVTTTAVSSIGVTSATGGGDVTAAGSAAVTARGVCWSTTSSPTTADSHTSDGSGTGAFSSSLTGLSPGTLYYVRAYATNSVGTSYGNQVSFTTAATTPTVSTTAASSVLTTSATSGGNVTASGGATVTARGVCWSTSSNPTTADSHTSDASGTGAFSSSLTGLSPGTLYYVRAYATNSVGTSYGNEVSFTTATTTPTVSTTAASSVSTTSATSGGNVSATGGAAVTARGVCWSTSSNPTTADSHTSDGSGTGAFSSSLTSLSPGTLYYVRAYATNSTGTAYGNEVSFTTAATTPTVSTTAVTSIGVTTATGGGDVTATGGAAVTARGVCWSTSPNPTTADNTTSDGSGTGTYSSSLTGLSPGTLYYVRAFATNSVGTSYGNEVTFTAAATTPTVSTMAASSVLTTSATSGGDVTATGGATVTARGVCWSTSSNPTTADSHTSDGSGTGTFTSSLSGLSPSTLYYVRAYAANSAGTHYGNEITLTTATPAPTDPPMANLALAVTATTATATVGDTITFDIAVENNGDADASRLTLSISLPGNTEYDSAPWTSSDSGAPATASYASVAAGVVTLTYGTLPAGTVLSIQFKLNTTASGTVHLSVNAGTSDSNVSGMGESMTDILVQDADTTSGGTIPFCGLGSLFGALGTLAGIPGLARIMRRSRSKRI